MGHFSSTEQLLTAYVQRCRRPSKYFLSMIYCTILKFIANTKKKNSVSWPKVVETLDNWKRNLDLLVL